MFDSMEEKLPRTAHLSNYQHSASFFAHSVDTFLFQS